MTKEQAEARHALEDKIFAVKHKLVELDYYPEEYHCWVCDALKPSADSACSCDRGYSHYGADE